MEASTVYSLGKKGDAAPSTKSSWVYKAVDVPAASLGHLRPHKNAADALQSVHELGAFEYTPAKPYGAARSEAVMLFVVVCDQNRRTVGKLQAGVAKTDDTRQCVPYCNNARGMASFCSVCSFVFENLGFLHLSSDVGNDGFVGGFEG
ncbi:hypothetical protein Nepgr_006615 [Nepenthes gracilis]|uniref:Uncharacterized protein n=1 Tax=Nepenthes gracilis TaxID=150966 RepID=A0AAD3S5T2_NEPGR|nr:hypothetical protein Nepgr_006615 [Nepenthes gracilis]